MKIKISFKIIIILMGITSFYLSDSLFIKNVMIFCIGFMVCSFVQSLDEIRFPSKKEVSDGS